MLRPLAGLLSQEKVTGEPETDRNTNYKQPLTENSRYLEKHATFNLLHRSKTAEGCYLMFILVQSKWPPNL